MIWNFKIKMIWTQCGASNRNIKKRNLFKVDFKPIKAELSSLLSFIFFVFPSAGCQKLPKLVQIGHISYAIKKLCLFSVSFDYFDVSVNCSQKLRKGEREKRKLGTFFLILLLVPSAPNQINHSPFFRFCTFLIQIPLQDNEKSFKSKGRKKKRKKEEKVSLQLTILQILLPAYFCSSMRVDFELHNVEI